MFRRKAAAQHGRPSHGQDVRIVLSELASYMSCTLHTGKYSHFFNYRWCLITSQSVGVFPHGETWERAQPSSDKQVNENENMTAFLDVSSKTWRLDVRCCHHLCGDACQELYPKWSPSGHPAVSRHKLTVIKNGDVAQKSGFGDVFWGYNLRTHEELLYVFACRLIEAAEVVTWTIG